MSAQEKVKREQLESELKKLKDAGTPATGNATQAAS